MSQKDVSVNAFNRKNPAVKRIMSEIREMQLHPSSEVYAAPLDDNIFEWHFTIRGPPKTEFEGGKYHGRIILPADYPFKPPSIMFLSQSGRFECNKKVCLSITGYHPEFWQPSWGIRTALMAIIAFFPTKSEGAIGGIDWKPEERKILAKRSNEWSCNTCGCKLADVLNEPSLTEAPNEKDLVDLSLFTLSYAKDSTQVTPAASTEATPVDSAPVTPLSQHASERGNALSGKLDKENSSTLITPTVDPVRKRLISSSKSEKESPKTPSSPKPELLMPRVLPNPHSERRQLIVDVLIVLIVFILVFILLRRFLSLLGPKY